MNFEVDTISAGSLSSDHLFVTLYTLSFYLSVYKHLIRAFRTLSETHIVYCPLKFVWEKIAFTNNHEVELETYEHITKYLLFGVNGRLNYLMLWKSCGALENPQISLAVSKAIQISILCEEKHRKIPNIYIYIYIYIFLIYFVAEKEMWPLNECVFYVQIQAAKTCLFWEFIG